MNYKLREIAKKIGAPLANRVIIKGKIEHDDEDEWYEGSHWYDGSTIATILEGRRLTDHDILHEIGHWFVASEEQRKLPEFGLGYGGLRWQRHVATHVSSMEADTQEVLTQIFCIIVGRKYELDPRLFDDGKGQFWESSFSWDAYEQAKKNESPWMWQQHWDFMADVLVDI